MMRAGSALTPPVASTRSPLAATAPWLGAEALYTVAYSLLGHDRVADAAKVLRALLRGWPRDERAWLGLGECHERIAQPRIALELYGAGAIVAESARCLIAAARLLRGLERGSEAKEALECAARIAADGGDDELAALVVREREVTPWS